MIFLAFFDLWNVSNMITLICVGSAYKFLAPQIAEELKESDQDEMKKGNNLLSSMVWQIRMGHCFISFWSRFFSSSSICGACGAKNLKADPTQINVIIESWITTKLLQQVIRRTQSQKKDWMNCWKEFSALRLVTTVHGWVFSCDLLNELPGWFLPSRSHKSVSD